MEEEKQNFKPTKANTNWPVPITDGVEGSQDTTEMVIEDTIMGNTTTPTGNPTTTTDGSPTLDGNNGNTPTGSGKSPVMGRIIPRINNYTEPREEYESKWLLELKPTIINTFMSLRNELKLLLDLTSNDIKLLYAMARLGKEDSVALLNIIDNEEAASVEHTLRYLWRRREKVAGGRYDFGLPERARENAARLEEEMAQLYPGQVLPGRDGKKVLDNVDYLQEVLKNVIKAGEAEIDKVKQMVRNEKIQKNEKENSLNSLHNDYTSEVEKLKRDKATLAGQVKKLKNELNKTKQDLALSKSKVNHIGKMVAEYQKGDKNANEAELKQIKEELNDLKACIIGYCPDETMNNLQDAKEILRKRLPRNGKLVKSLQDQLKAVENERDNAISDADFKHYIWGVEKSKTNSMIKRALRTLGGGNVLISGISEKRVRDKFNQVTDDFQYKWHCINETRQELINKGIILDNDLTAAMNAVYASNAVNPAVFKPTPSPDQVAAQEMGANFKEYKEKKARNELFINPEFAYTARPDEFRPAFRGAFRGGRGGYMGNNTRGRGRGGFGINNTKSQPNMNGNSFSFNK